MRVAVLLALAGLACDVDRPWPAPDPGLERMVHQRPGRPDSESPLFSDGKLLREPPPGVIAYRRGAAEPIVVDAALLAQGRRQFEVVCATCHGEAGDGRSAVASHMQLRKPPSLHEARLRELDDAVLYRVAVAGYGLMPGYGAVLDEKDRRAVVAYVRALQRARHSRLDELPPALRAEARRSLP
jgi:mono/diheme cytochrome c family protein